MRWAKGDEFVEIEKALSEEHGGPVFIVSSSYPLKDLPVEWRGSVISQADQAGLNNLIASMSKWCEAKGFKRQH